MSNPSRNRPPKPVAIGNGDYGLWKLGAMRFDLRDPYHSTVSLSWPGFILVLVLVWLAINLVFATVYVLSPGDIANTRPGSFSDAMFFSIETLATVGYGVMAPTSLYGHIVSSLEIVTGMAFTAIFTGLLFVRFSRPKAKIIYADDAVVAIRNGHPTLMVRFANARLSILSNASARLFLLLAERTKEGAFYRRIHELRLVQSHLPLFVMPWTLLHVIDEGSPLHGHSPESLPEHDARLFLTIEARDQTLAAQVQDLKDYRADRIRFGMRYANAVTTDEKGEATADLSMIGVLEEDTDNPHLDAVSYFDLHQHP